MPLIKQERCPLEAQTRLLQDKSSRKHGASLVPQWLKKKKKNLPVNAGDLGSIPGLERAPGGGHGNTLQYSCLEIP